MAVPKGSESEMIGAETIGSGRDDLDTNAAFAGWTDAPASSNAPAFCKFLRSIGSDGKLFDPGREAVPTHRCAAFGDPLPLSLRQQELVCLQRVHVSCPRYMRGTLLAEESAAAAVENPPHSGMPYLTIAGLGLVAVAGVAAIAGMMGVLPGSTGGGNPSGSPSLPVVAVGSPTATPTAAPTVTLVPTPAPTRTAAPTPSASPTPTPTPTATPTPVASPTWPPGATASRMKLLVPCTDQANCYVYTVRGPGPAPAGNGSKVADQLPSLAKFFGVSLNSIYDLNPWARSGIHPGDKLKIPPPTR